MTTMISNQEQPPLPHASAYSRHADYILARQESERHWRMNRKRDRRRRAVLVGALLLVLAMFFWL